MTALQYSKRNSSFRQESCLWVNYGLAISDIETGYKPSTIRLISYYSLYLHRRLQIPYMLVVKEDVKELFLVWCFHWIRDFGGVLFRRQCSWQGVLHVRFIEKRVDPQGMDNLTQHPLVHHPLEIHYDWVVDEPHLSYLNNLHCKPS